MNSTEVAASEKKNTERSETISKFRNIICCGEGSNLYCFEYSNPPYVNQHTVNDFIMCNKFSF